MGVGEKSEDGPEDDEEGDGVVGKWVRSGRWSQGLLGQPFAFVFSSSVPRGRRSLRTSPLTTASVIDLHDQKSVAWLSDSIPSLKFFLSFACGTLGIMLATTTPTIPSLRWSFSFFNTRIEFRSMFVATLFLFLFLCLGQYLHFAPITPFLGLSFSVFAFSPCRLAQRDA